MWYKEISRYHIFSLVLVFKKYNTNKCFFGKYDRSNNLICLIALYVEWHFNNGKGQWNKLCY